MKKTLLTLLTVLSVTGAIIYGGTIVQANINDAGLIGYWRYDNNDISGSSLSDISGSGFTATIHGAVSAVGQISQGMLYTRANKDYVSVANTGALNFGTAPFTVSEWIKFNTVGSIYEGFLSKDDANDFGGWFLVANSGGQIGFTLVAFPSSNDCETAGTYTSTSVWYHVVGVRDGANVKVYVNGVQDCSVSDTGINVNNTEIMTLAGPYRSADLANHFFDGTADDARVYNRGLSAAEVKQLYMNGKTRHTTQF